MEVSSLLALLKANSASLKTLSRNASAYPMFDYNEEIYLFS